VQARNSRREILAAAGAGAALLVAGCGGDEAKPARPADGGSAMAPGDLAVLSFALTLEYFEADLYERLVAERILDGRDQELARTFAQNEAEHVDALEATIKDLGGRRPERPRPDFEKLLAGGPDAILARAADIENLGAAAYLGQAAKIQNDEILAAALSIHAIEARHAAVLNRRVGRSFVPDGALGVPMTSDEVLARVSEFLA